MAETSDSFDDGGACWTWIERIVEQFEGAWQCGQRPAIEDYLAPGGDRFALLMQLVRADLEGRFKAGESARIEDYLRRFPDLAEDRQKVLALLAWEHHLRRRRQPDLSPSDYERRFPAYAAELSFLFGEVISASRPDSQPPTLPARTEGISEATPFPNNGTGSVPTLPIIPGYEMLEPLGRGGMGVVYKARQFSLKRIVALKMLRDGALADAELRARFRGEAESVARLRHPHIVQIYEIGEHEGRPYLALEYAEGGSLAGRLARGSLPLREAVGLLETVARAVHAAHEAGVLHRDLTPANILLAADGSPRIGDFGLAKRLDGEAMRTHTGAVLGTPSYMAPEQAAGEGKRVGPATDVYALGAILYELLVGRPPFRGQSPLETLSQVLTEEPVSPRRFDTRLPRDVETICLKCLGKEPRRRYPSALALAEDLKRWRAGEPVQARPSPSWERAAKWVRRRPVVALLLVSLLTVLGLAVGFVWRTAEREWALQYAREKDTEARHKEELARKHENELHRQRYALDLRGAHRFWINGHVRQALERLELHKPRPEATEPGGFAWRYLWQVCHDGAPECLSSGDEALWATFSPDGALLATAHTDGSVRVWVTATRQLRATLKVHREAVHWLSFAPDGRSLFTASVDGTLRSWDVERGVEACQLAGPDERGLRWLPSADGQVMAAAQPDNVVVVRPTDGTPSRRMGSHPDRVTALAFSGDGRALAVGCRNGGVGLCDLATASLRIGFHHNAPISALAVTPDGQGIAVAGEDGSVMLHVLAGRQTIHCPSHEGAVRCLAFAPDHGMLASVGDDNIVRIWDMSTGVLRNALRGHTDRVHCVAFSPDGRRLVTVSRDGTIRLWDPAARQDREALVPPSSAITRVGWASDGRLAATAHQDRTVKLWDTTTWHEVGGLTGHCGDVQGLAFAPNNRLLATASADRTVKLWDVACRRQTGCLEHGSAVLCVAFVSADRSLASGEENGEVTLWDTARGARLHGIARQNGPVRALAVAPDGRTMASASDDRTVRLWETVRWQPGHTLTHAHGVVHVTFSPDGRMLASTETSGDVTLWDAVSGERLSPVNTLWEPFHSAAFAPDGRTLVLAGRKVHLAVYDVSNRQAPVQWHCQWDNDSIVGMSFMADGQSLAAVSADGQITLWSARDWKVRRPCGSASGPIRALAFSPDGAILATACATTMGWSRLTSRLWPASRNIHIDSALVGSCAESLCFWDVATRKSCSLLAPQQAVMRPTLLAYSPDGRTLATAQADGTVWLWDMAGGRRRAVLPTDLQARAVFSQEESILRGMRTCPERVERVCALAFAPDGRTLAVIAPGGDVQLWDPANGERIAVLPRAQRDATCLAFAPDGRTLATHYRGEVELWDVGKRRLRRTRRLHQESTIRCLAFSPDGRRLASGAGDCSVKLWDLADDADILMSGHTDSISSVAFAPDGRTLVTGGFDRVVRVWDLATAQEVMSLEGHTGKIHCLAFAPDGRTLATGGETTHGSGEVYLWRAVP
jgi:WD40 repeat protein/tRNA A-37 threonylcarbamoyl transferase component Bud32